MAAFDGCYNLKFVNSVINVGVNPNGIAITPDGKWAYVANNNNYFLSGQDTVTVIDLCTNLPHTTIKHESFNQPYTVTINESGTKSYVTNSGGSTISVIRIKTNKVIQVIEGFDGPSGLTIHKNIGYVNNYGATPGVGSGNGTTVSILDLCKGEIIGEPIEVGLAPAAIVNDGKFVYTINYTDGEPNTGTISRIRIKDLSVNTIGPFEENGLSGPFGIALIKNNKRNGKNAKALITNFGSNNFTPFGTTVSLVNLSRGCIIDTIEVGIQPSGIAVYCKGRYAIVSNYNTLYAYITPPPVEYLNLTPGQGTINIIDLHRKKVIHTKKVGQSPANIAIDPAENQAYITNYTSNTVSVVKLPY